LSPDSNLDPPGPKLVCPTLGFNPSGIGITFKRLHPNFWIFIIPRAENPANPFRQIVDQFTYPLHHIHTDLLPKLEALIRQQLQKASPAYTDVKGRMSAKMVSLADSLHYFGFSNPKL